MSLGFYSYTVRSMSLAEVKAEVSQLSDADLEELAAYVQLARKTRDPQWLTRVTRANAQMDAGHSHSEADFQRVHEALVREGR